MHVSVLHKIKAGECVTRTLLSTTERLVHPFGVACQQGATSILDPKAEEGTSDPSHFGLRTTQGTKRAHLRKKVRKKPPRERERTNENRRRERKSAKLGPTLRDSEPTPNRAQIGRNRCFETGPESAWA